ncbi:arginase [Aquamicrobium defluvii]|uniref:Arginase n=1 Tax=Aquamicrobium defluvii TaxID=69279 RepID=A0A011VLS5_9HYPH|nr:arginase [Aquamicrobium defluvii]EXL09360.1 arginase [Aquamicrobium defluvii]EZQ15525.1 arginase [Halopseudomonas bauzanensis]TDR36197.1 arginase [Aquamicrobium defluvii]
MNCKLISVPVEQGQPVPGCALGPEALKGAGLAAALRDLGHEVVDLGPVPGPQPRCVPDHPNHLKFLPEISAWIEATAAVAYEAGADGFPIFLGGDHSISAGSVSGLARRAAEQGRPLFVLWMDAHSDFHTLDTTTSGNLHGVPLAYLCGLPGFENYFPPLPAPLAPERVCILGLRSVDKAEREALAGSPVRAYDMSAIDRKGIGPLLESFLDEVRAANGLLHVSFDVDFLDPPLAPGVGTPVQGGATFREAHLAMEMLHESGLVTSLDVVELNPTLDERGRTAGLAIELVGSLLGKTITGRRRAA